MRLLIGTIVLFAIPAFAQEDLTPMELARNVSSNGPIYAYSMTYETKEFSAKGRVDPTLPEGKRITIDSPAKEDWPPEFEENLRDIDAEADGDIWCASMMESVPDNAKIDPTGNGYTRYAFKPKGENKEDKKFMKHLNGSIDIDPVDGAVLAFRMWSEKAFKPHMLVKVHSFQMDAKCARAPDGRTYAAEVETKITASAAMQKIDEHSVRKITALYPPG